MASLKTGLAVSVVIGALLAAFPLYADRLTGYIWGAGSAEAEGRKGRGGYGGEPLSISGTVGLVDKAEHLVVVDGAHIKVIGLWKLSGSMSGEVEAEELLSMMCPGEPVIVVAVRQGKWGIRAVEIE
ncbi:MAG: hypothetical protein QI199_08135, partial [Candidatus Korarchaeota archaeon]|nr:hypothetical protein [Candidatus Korarchaeota archaeon]